MSFFALVSLGELGQATEFNFLGLYVYLKLLFSSLNGGNTVLVKENRALRKINKPLTIAFQGGRKC